MVIAGLPVENPLTLAASRFTRSMVRNVYRPSSEKK